jgi:hypothetical protein
MKYRKLRIAWTVGWALTTILLGVLWIRSYWVWDLWDNGIRPPNGGFSSIRGGLGGSMATDPTRRSPLSDLEHVSTPVQPSQRTNWWWLHYNRNARLTNLMIPYWMPVIAATVIAAGPWMSWRFSLRSLFIAMTIAAVVLSLIVYFTIKR